MAGLLEEDPCACTVCQDGAYRPAPAAASLAAGAIGRGLADAQAAYREELVDLWRGVVAALPDD